MKNLTLVSVALSALFLSACGSSKSETAIADKAGVLIYEGAARGACTSDNFKNALYNQGYRDFITKETSTNTTCRTYSKSTQTCRQIPVNVDNVNCVVGFNNYVGTNIENNTAFYETQELIESTLQ